MKKIIALVVLVGLAILPFRLVTAVKDAEVVPILPTVHVAEVVPILPDVADRLI